MTKHDATKQIIALAKTYDFILIRKKKHLIFKHPSGATLVTSGTTGDWRALKNVEANIKHILLKHDSNYTN